MTIVSFLTSSLLGEIDRPLMIIISYRPTHFHNYQGTKWQRTQTKQQSALKHIQSIQSN